MNEGYSASVNFTFTRSDPSNGQQYLVDFQMSGTARFANPETDYTVSGNLYQYDPSTGAGKVNLQYGSAAITVTASNDSLYEGDETVTVTPAGGSGATATIIDNDPQPATVTVAAVDAEAKEAGPERGRLKFTRSGGYLAGAMTAKYRVRNPNPPEVGVANANDYWLPGSGVAGMGADAGYMLHTVTFAANVTEVFVDLTPFADALPEGDETVTAEVVSDPTAGTGYYGSTGYVGPTGYTAAGSPATITIKDKPVVSVVATDPAASEVGPDTGTYRVSRALATAEALAVHFRYPGNGVFTATDVTSPALTVDATGALLGSVTIPGGLTFADVILTPAPDGLVEGDEAATMGLTGNPDNPTAYAIDAGAATVIIRDMPVVRIAATDPIASEPGTNTATLTVSRSGSGDYLSNGLTVLYSVSGSATPGADYYSLSGTVTIAPGQSSAPVVITPQGDMTLEPVENVHLALLASPLYFVAPAPDAEADAEIEDPKIEIGGPDTLWWFNGEDAQHYAESGQLTATGLTGYVLDNPGEGGALPEVTWKVDAGTKQVELKDDDDPALSGDTLNPGPTDQLIEVHATKGSVELEDVTVQLIVGGRLLDEHDLTVRTPDNVFQAGMTDEANGIGYKTTYWFQIRDQFNAVLPRPVEFTETLDNWEPIFDGENWRDPTPTGTGDVPFAMADPTRAGDVMTSDNADGVRPVPVNPGTALNPTPGQDVAVDRVTQRYYVGGRTSGTGVLVATFTTTRYRGYARQVAI